MHDCRVVLEPSRVLLRSVLRVASAVLESSRRSGFDEMEWRLARVHQRDASNRRWVDRHKQELELECITVGISSWCSHVSWYSEMVEALNSWVSLLVM